MAYHPDDLDGEGFEDGYGWKQVDYASPTLGGHTHTDSRGYIHWCYHQCRHRWYLWIPLVYFAQLMLFGLEHQMAEWIWTSTPGLDSVAEYMGWFEDHGEA